MKISEIDIQNPASKKPIGSDPDKASQTALKAETIRTTKLEKALTVAIDALIQQRTVVAQEQLKTSALIYALTGSPQLNEKYKRRYQELLESDKLNATGPGNNKLKAVRP